MSIKICIHESMQNINKLHNNFNIKLAKVNGKHNSMYKNNRNK